LKEGKGGVFVRKRTNARAEGILAAVGKRKNSGLPHFVTIFGSRRHQSEKSKKKEEKICGQNPQGETGSKTDLSGPNAWAEGEMRKGKTEVIGIKEEKKNTHEKERTLGLCPDRKTDFPERQGQRKPSCEKREAGKGEKCFRFGEGGSSHGVEKGENWETMLNGEVYYWGKNFTQEKTQN